MRRGSTLVVGQSGGGTAVINASLAGLIEAAQAGNRFDRIVGLVHGVEGLLAGEIVDLSTLSAAQLDTLAATPSAALGSCRYKLQEADLEPLLERLTGVDAGAFCYIGGDDSARTTARVAAAAREAGRDLAAVAIPKTIDNDLPDMDHTPGYGSAAKAFAAFVQDVAVDALAMRRVEPVRIIESKGRDSGWLTLAGALARPASGLHAPHLVYPPERPLIEDSFLAQVERCLQAEGYCVVVVAETVRDREGQLLGESAGSDFVDAFGHRYTDGPGPYLARLAGARLGVRARFDRPGTWLKTAGLLASPVDRAEARAIGREAARLASRPDAAAEALMVTIDREAGQDYRVSYGSTPLDRVIGRVKKVPDGWLPQPDGALDAAFVAYVTPLLGDPLPHYLQLID